MDLVIEERHSTAHQRTGPNTYKQLIVKFHRRVKLNSGATVCNLPTLWDTDGSISAIGWQSGYLIASSAIRFQIPKRSHFLTSTASQYELSDGQFCAL